MLLYGIALLGLPLIAGVACEAPAASPTIDPNNKQIYANANEAFQDLLNALPEESLHAALNSLTGFKAGVFESNRHGVEHVHHDNPPLATKLIVAAVQDLKKRQAPAPSANSTASSAEPSSSNPPTQTSGQSLSPSSPPSSTGPPPSSSPPPESSSPPQSSNPPESSNPPPASSSPPPVVLPVQVTTTDADGKPTVISTSIYSDVTAFIPVDVTRTDAQGSTLVTKESKPAVIFTATDSAGSAFVTASAVNFAPTLGQVLTSTDSAGSTFITTYTPTGGRVSRIVLVTTTDGDGRPSVVTSYTYVDPVGPTGVDQVETTRASRTGAASLQTNAARANGVRDVAFLGGFVGVFALFV